MSRRPPVLPVVAFLALTLLAGGRLSAQQFVMKTFVSNKDGKSYEYPLWTDVKDPTDTCNLYRAVAEYTLPCDVRLDEATIKVYPPVALLGGFALDPSITCVTSAASKFNTIVSAPTPGTTDNTWTMTWSNLGPDAKGTVARNVEVKVEVTVKTTAGGVQSTGVFFPTKSTTISRWDLPLIARKGRSRSLEVLLMRCRPWNGVAAYR